jgi:cytochrome P450 family 142 subfamily A polypeptide 1
MRQHAPVYWDEPGQVWGIACYGDLLEISKRPEAFSNSAGIRPDSPSFPYMINLDDPLHKRRRNLVNRGFTLRRVQDREPRIRELARRLVSAAARKERFDFVREIAAPLPLMVIGDMLGVDPADYARLLAWSDDLVKGSGATDPARIESATKAFGEYSAYQLAVIADRRGRPPQDDLVSILVHAEIDGERLDDETLLWECMLILIGGDETTRHVISGGMYQLLLQRELVDRLRSHPAVLPTAVEEMLRWVSPIKNMARTVVNDVEVRGQALRRGQKLLLLYPSANRDAEVFPDPFRFDIERTPNEHVAFGFGPHYCLGASLARLELRVVFEEILAALPELRLAGIGLPAERSSNFISGIERLDVTLGG